MTEEMADGCREIIEEYQNKFESFFQVEKDNDNPLRDLVRGGINFGVDTLKVVCLVIHNNRNDLRFAFMLCRPFFENSARILWASYTEDGRERLYKGYISEQKRYFKKVKKKFPEDKYAKDETAKKRIKFVEKMLVYMDKESTGFNEEIYGKPPKLEKMLEEIVEESKHDDLGRLYKKMSPYFYISLYQPLSKNLHENIFDKFTMPKEYSKVFRSCIWFSTIFITHALLIISDAPDIVMDILAIKFSKIW